MKNLMASIKNDMILQYKYGFYFVYAILSVAYILIIRFSPEEYRQLVALAVIFSDPALLGFFFIGAIVLLEKSERVLTFLVITPLRDMEYILSKMISLSILSLISSLLIFILGNGMNGNIFLLVISVTLVSMLFVAIGLIAVSKFKTVNEYLMTAVGYTIVLLVPVIQLTGLVDMFVLKLWPTYGALILIKASFYSVPLIEVGCGLVNAFFYLAMAYTVALKLFRKYIVAEGEE